MSDTVWKTRLRVAARAMAATEAVHRNSDAEVVEAEARLYEVARLMAYEEIQHITEGCECNGCILQKNALWEGR